MTMKVNPTLIYITWLTLATVSVCSFFFPEVERICKQETVIDTQGRTVYLPIYDCHYDIKY